MPRLTPETEREIRLLVKVKSAPWTESLLAEIDALRATLRVNQEQAEMAQRVAREELEKMRDERDAAYEQMWNEAVEEAVEEAEETRGDLRQARTPPAWEELS